MTRALYFVLLTLNSKSQVESHDVENNFRKFNMGLDTEGLIEFHVNVFWEKKAQETCPPGHVKKPFTFPSSKHPCETGIVCQGFVISEWWSITAAHCIL